MKSVCQQARLDGHIERRGTCETGVKVDLEKPGLQLIVYHHIEAKDLEESLMRGQGTVVNDPLLEHKQGLHNQFLDLVIYLVVVQLHLLELPT